MRLAAILFCSMLLAHCTSLGTQACNADWRQVGERDGRMGATSQFENYAARCPGARPEAALYAEGWQSGLASRPLPTW
jgi:uncharacterized protein DUF2799